MKLKSSYIFLNNPYKKEIKQGKKLADIGTEAKINKSVYYYIWQSFPDGQVVNEFRKFYEKKYICSVQRGKNIFDVEFIYHDVEEVKYLDVLVEGKSKAQIIGCLEYVQDKVMNSGIRTEYIDIISYDAISEYYCNKIFGKLNKLERNLRKLLFNIYTLNLGYNYYEKTIKTDLQGKIKAVINSSNSKEKRNKLKGNFHVSNSEADAILYLQQFFYSVEFGDIQSLLFEKKWSKINEETRDKFLSEHADLTMLSDVELRKVLYDISPQSDWERFFSAKIGTANIETTIEKIRLYRNTIAHLKMFDKEDYHHCNQLIMDFNTDIERAIRLTEEVDFARKHGGLYPITLSAFINGYEIELEVQDREIRNHMQYQTVQRLMSYHRALQRMIDEEK